MRNIAVMPNIYRDNDLSATKDIVDILIGYGKKIFMEDKFKGHSSLSRYREISYANIDEILEHSELLVVLGGDGTILNIADKASRYDIPILGINFGNLGFLSQAEKGDNTVFEKLFSGKYSIRQNMMLSVKIKSESGFRESFTALNDVVIRGEYSRMINLELAVNGTRVSSYPADGIIVATATGSTAYSLSAGGPIVHPDIDAMVITPICPHTLSERCMVIPSESTVKIGVASPKRLVDAVVTIDGQKAHVLNDGEYVEVEKLNRRIKLVNLFDRNFFGILKEKL